MTTAKCAATVVLGARVIVVNAPIGPAPPPLLLPRWPPLNNTMPQDQAGVRRQRVLRFARGLQSRGAQGSRA
jgi:hypothetical protein